MVKEIIGFIAAVLVFVAYIPYFRDILKGKTRPHPYSWFVWGLTTALIFSLQVSHGAGAGAYTTGTVVAISFIVCILGLKYGIKDIVFFDTICLVLALVATAIWLFAKQPTISMILLVTIDMLGFAPSVRKAWHKPNEETLSLWAFNGLRHGLSLVALKEYSLITVLNPAVWTIANIAFSLMLLGRRSHTEDA